jgi:thymidylate kinase
MAKAVEIIGPSGAGKSTIYKTLKSDWEFEYNWVTYEQLKYSNGRISDRFSRLSKALLNKSKSLLSSKRKKPAIVPEWGFISHSDRTFLGDKYSGFKKIVMDLIEDHCRTGYSGEDKRFITIYMIMWSIAYYETIKAAKNDNRFCILRQGEGLISRIMHLNSPTFDEDALKIYLEHVPFPDILIYLDVEPESVVERVMTRDRKSTLHDGMSEDVILEYTKSTRELLSKASVYAEKAGKKVYRLDASQPVEKTVSQIKTILSGS